MAYLNRRAAVAVFVLASLLAAPSGTRLWMRHRMRGGPEGITDGSNQKIDAVSETLKDILASVEGAEREEAANYKCFMEWCHKEVSSSSEGLAETKQLSEEGQVEEKELTATLEGLAHALEDIQNEITETSNLIDQATGLRGDEKQKYDEDVQINKQSLDQVTRAIKIVGGVGNKGFFLQGGVKRRLQINEPGESSYVLGIMKGLKERLEKSKSEMEATEATSNEKANTLLATKKAQASQLQDEKALKGEMTTENGVALAEVKNSVKKSLKQIDELTVLLQDTVHRCDAKKQWWHRRGQDRLQEKAALKQAINFVTESTKGGDGGGPVGPVLLQIAKEAPSPDGQLAALQALVGGAAATGDKGMLDGAKKIVNDLIAVLLKEEKGEKVKHTYCKTEIAEKEADKERVTSEIEQLTATIGDKQARIDLLNTEVPQINGTADQLLTQLDTARIGRRKEAADYKSQKSDRVLAVKVLGQAKEVLRQFYETKDNTALLAEEKRAAAVQPPPTAQGSSRQGVQSFGVIQMLDAIIDDIHKESKQADIEEKEASVAFTELQSNTQKEFDELMSEMGDRLKQKAKLLVTMGTSKEDKSHKEDDLDSTNDQLSSLHDACDDLLEHFEKRVSARNFEISQLRDVLDILSGSSIASRTGFLEQKLLQDVSRSVSSLRHAR